MIRDHTSVRKHVLCGHARSLPHHAYAEGISLTRKLIDDGAPAIVEASFLADIQRTDTARGELRC